MRNLPREPNDKAWHSGADAHGRHEFCNHYGARARDVAGNPRPHALSWLSAPWRMAPATPAQDRSAGLPLTCLSALPPSVTFVPERECDDVETGKCEDLHRPIMPAAGTWIA